MAIVWLEDKEKANPETGEVPNKLPARYADPRTSNLKATVDDVINQVFAKYPHSAGSAGRAPQAP